MRPGRPSSSTVIAVLALVVALGGTAVAAGRYVITSQSQIKPSVLKGLSEGGSGMIVARVRSVAPVATVSPPGLAWIALAGSSWTQGAEEVDQIGGEVNYTLPPGCAVRPFIDIWLDGVLTSARVAPLTNPGEQASATTQTRWIEWRTGSGRPATTAIAPLQEPIFEPGRATPHRITTEASDTCPSGHITINSVSLDVLGAR